MDLINIFTALNDFVKPCCQLLFLLTSYSRGRFWFTSISLWNRFNRLVIANKIRNRLTSGIANDRITCIAGTDSFTNIKCFDELANTAAATFIRFCHIIVTDSWWFDELTNTTYLTDIMFCCITGADRFTNMYYWKRQVKV